MYTLVLDYAKKKIRIDKLEHIVPCKNSGCRHEAGRGYMKIASVGILRLVMLLTCTAGLYAETITETINGTILSGIDNAGVFGAPGVNLAGAAATFTFILNRTVLVTDGLYTSSAGITEHLFNATVADGAITNSITVHGTTFTLTQTAGGEETFLTQRIGGGSLVESLLFNPISGVGSNITVNSNTPYQFPTLLGSPKSFLDLVSATVTSVNVDIDLQGGAFETDLILTPLTPIPEPSSLRLWMLLGALSLYIIRKKRWSARG